MDTYRCRFFMNIILSFVTSQERSLLWFFLINDFYKVMWAKWLFKKPVCLKMFLGFNQHLLQYLEFCCFSVAEPPWRYCRNKEWNTLEREFLELYTPIFKNRPIKVCIFKQWVLTVHPTFFENMKTSFFWYIVELKVVSLLLTVLEVSWELNFWC